MYILYNVNTMNVIGKPSKNPIVCNNNDFAQAECEIIPKLYDYLSVENIREEIRIIKEAYSETFLAYDEETGQEYEKTIEYPAATESYLACDIVPKFITLTLEQEKVKLDKKYDILCERYIRQIYSANDESKILREIRAYADNEKVIARFDKYNADIESCLNRAHIEIYGTERTI